MIEPERIADGWRAEGEVALASALAASDLVMAMRAQAGRQTKADGSIVTAADLAAADLIRDTILATFPDDAVLTEEDKAESDRLQHRRCWIVDPIDGTEQFAGGADDFDVFVTLAMDGAIVVAVSVQPVTGMVLFATAGGGSHVRGQGRWSEWRAPQQYANPVVGTRIWLGAPEDLLIFKPLMHEMGGRIEVFEDAVSPRSFLADLDALVGLVPPGEESEVWEWDIAPYGLLLREAGGLASDAQGAPLRFNQPDPRFQSGVVFARSAELGQRLVAELSERR